MRKIVGIQLLVGKHQPSVYVRVVCEAHYVALVMELAYMYVDKSHAKIHIYDLSVDCADLVREWVGSWVENNSIQLIGLTS
jgi:hypothetical protein